MTDDVEVCDKSHGNATGTREDFVANLRLIRAMRSFFRALVPHLHQEQHIVDSTSLCSSLPPGVGPFRCSTRPF